MVGALALVAVTFLVFLPALSNGFLNWDDIHLIQSNAVVLAAHPVGTCRDRDERSRDTLREGCGGS